MIGGKHEETTRESQPFLVKNNSCCNVRLSYPLSDIFYFNKKINKYIT